MREINIELLQPTPFFREDLSRGLNYRGLNHRERLIINSPRDKSRGNPKALSRL